MSSDYVAADYDDLPFVRGVKGYREIVEALRSQSRDKPPIKDLAVFCKWLGSQPDMKPVIDLAVERYTFDISLLQKLLRIAGSTPSPLSRGVL